LTVLVALGTVAGCTSGGDLVAPSAASGQPATSELTHLTVGLGYIPSVQFAPFYLAQEAGYYRAAGLDVTFQNRIDPDLIVLIGQGAVDIGIGDGTSVIPAVSQGVPIRYVATIYGSLPNVVFAKADSGIRGASDLRGKRVGTPCRCGSNWIMLQALLQAAGLSASDIDVVEYPDFGQAGAVAHGAVDAATGYVANEPIQLEEQGISVSVLHLDQTVALPGPGLIAGTVTSDTKGDALRAFVAATLRAMGEIVVQPQRGLDAALQVVPELKVQRDLQRTILEATVASWSSPYTEAHGLGAIDTAAWEASVRLMTSLPDHPVAKPVGVDQLVDSTLLPSG